MNVHLETHIALQLADDAWSAELEKVFGKNAGDMRYTSYGRGENGSDLRRAYDARKAAQIAWEEARNMGPVK